MVRDEVSREELELLVGGDIVVGLVGWVWRGSEGCGVSIERSFGDGLGGLGWLEWVVGVGGLAGALAGGSVSYALSAL